MIVTVSVTTSMSSLSAISTSAARLLLPFISPLDVHLLIERELTKTSEPATVTDGAASIPPRTCPSGDMVSSLLAVDPNTVVVSTAPQCVPVGHQSVPLASDTYADNELLSDNSDSCRQTDDCKAAVCSVRQSNVAEKQPPCCKLFPTTNIKKSESDSVLSEYDGSNLSTHLAARQTHCSLPTDGYVNEFPFKRSAALAGFGKNRPSSQEINNNCRRSSVHSEKIVGNVAVGRDAAVRKSKRCNRGRRYHELISQGVLPHHTSRKRSVSVTV